MSCSNLKINASCKLKFCLFFFSFCLLHWSLTAQHTPFVAVDSTIFKTFQRDTLLKMTLHTNTKQLVSKKYKEEWQTINIKFSDNEGEVQNWEAKVRARGNIRKRVCYYPPLKLKLKKKWLVKNGIDSTFNDLKLVVGCKKGDHYGKLVLKEYLIYQLYEALTGISFKTQLAEIEFIDTEDKWKPFSSYAFFIENEDEMATRLNAKCAKPKKLSSKYIYADQLDKMTLFQYMIGNTDWSAIGSHNVRLIKCKEFPLPLPIAYDFDYAGFVNAPYAVHGEGINLERITDRLYLGMCREPGVLEKLIPIFLEKKDTFFKIIEDFPYLEKGDKKTMINYLQGFYRVLNNPKSFKRNIANLCREKGR